MFGISPHSGGGSGLKLWHAVYRRRRRHYLPSLRWGERIETWSNTCASSRIRRISPHSGGGSGLKHHHIAFWRSVTGHISPHSGGGSGLKRAVSDTHQRTDSDLPSLRWGERIETDNLRWLCRACHKNLPSLRWGERIETLNGQTCSIGMVISPHSGGGSGLKLMNVISGRLFFVQSPLTPVGGAD